MRSTVRVLIADDDATIRLWLDSVLREWGYETVLADNGDAAWHLLQQDDSPELVLLDWLMPGLDGLEVCRRIKADPQKRFSYVIMLTARTTTEDFVAALDAGADDLVRKP
ncbi:sensory transduction histidine kinase, putative, partial [Ricinus communis]